MRNPISLACASCLLIQALWAGSAPVEKLEVGFKVQPASKERGRLVILFKPNPEYDFNKVPPVTVQVEPVQGVEWDKTKQLPRDGKPKAGSHYYGQIEPVEFNYTLLQSRKVEVQAKITYFYCSKKDGFCAREIKKVVIPLGPVS